MRALNTSIRAYREKDTLDQTTHNISNENSPCGLGEINTEMSNINGYSTEIGRIKENGMHFNQSGADIDRDMRLPIERDMDPYIDTDMKLQGSKYFNLDGNCNQWDFVENDIGFSCDQGYATNNTPENYSNEPSILSTVHSLRDEPRSIDSIISHLNSIFPPNLLQNAEKILRVLTSRKSVKQIMSDTGLPKYRILEIMGKINNNGNIVKKDIERGQVYYTIIE